MTCISVSLTLKSQTPQAPEIVATGVLPRWQRCGIGRALVEEASRFVLTPGARLLQVKTLGPSHPSDARAPSMKLSASSQWKKQRPSGG